MFAWPSVRTIEPARQGEPGIGAVVYQNDRYPDAVFKWIVGECRARGLVLSGVLQYPAFEGADQDCDVVLEDIASGHRTRLKVERIVYDRSLPERLFSSRALEQERMEKEFRP